MNMLNIKMYCPAMSLDNYDQANGIWILRLPLDAPPSKEAEEKAKSIKDDNYYENGFIMYLANDCNKFNVFYVDDYGYNNYMFSFYSDDLARIATDYAIQHAIVPYIIEDSDITED